MKCRYFHNTAEYMIMPQKHSVVLLTDYAAHWDHIVEVDTTDTVIYNKHLFDPDGFLVHFFQT
jgi:hypothetical protein